MDDSMWLVAHSCLGQHQQSTRGRGESTWTSVKLSWDIGVQGTLDPVTQSPFIHLLYTVQGHKKKNKNSTYSCAYYWSSTSHFWIIRCRRAGSLNKFQRGWRGSCLYCSYLLTSQSNSQGEQVKKSKTDCLAVKPPPPPLQWHAIEVITT